MSKKANPTAIGVFIVVAALLAVFAVVVFDSSRFFTKKQRIVMYFDESVNGLDIGAPLKFKGVRIGQVVKIYIDFNQSDEHTSIPVIAEIDVTHFRENLGAKMDITSEAVIQQMIEQDGLRARLQQSSFVTGLLFVELNYHKKAPAARYVQGNNPNYDTYPEIPTLPGNMAQLLENITTTLTKVSEMDLVGISQKANSILAKVDSGMGEIAFAQINAELVGSLTNMRELTGNDNLHEAFRRLGPMIASATQTLEGFTAVLGQFTEITGRVDDLLSDDSPVVSELSHTLQELSRMLNSLRVLSDYLERNPSSLFMGKQNDKR